MKCLGEMNDLAELMQNQKSELTLSEKGINNVSLEHTLNILLSNNLTHSKSSLFNFFFQTGNIPIS